LRYVAFLRAINVGGHTVRMEALRRVFETSGARDVETFIASGNVIFESSARRTADLEIQIESALEKALKFSVATFVRTLPELAAAAQHPAFSVDMVTAAVSLWVGFLKTPPDAEVCAAVAAASTPSHRFAIQGREIYWLRKDRTDYSGPKLEKTIGPTTFRNITTVRKLAAIYCTAPTQTKRSSRTRSRTE
jgi:uncharacterized protein (DUF1697 family)